VRNVPAATDRVPGSSPFRAEMGSGSAFKAPASRVGAARDWGQRGGSARGQTRCTKVRTAHTEALFLTNCGAPRAEGEDARKD